MNRFDPQEVRALGRFVAHPLLQFAEWRIDLILEKGGARAGTALPNIAAVDQDAIDTRLYQPVRQQCAADSPADNQRVTVQVFHERRGRTASDHFGPSRKANRK